MLRLLPFDRDRATDETFDQPQSGMLVASAK